MEHLLKYPTKSCKLDIFDNGSSSWIYLTMAPEVLTIMSGIIKLPIITKCRLQYPLAILTICMATKIFNQTQLYDSHSLCHGPYSRLKIFAGFMIVWTMGSSSHFQISSLPYLHYCVQHYDI